MHFTKLSALVASLAVALFVCLGSVQAAFVPPGTTPTAPDFPLVVTPGSTLLATTGLTTVSTTLGGDTLTVTYFENVYADAALTCPGCLDFVIMASNTGAAGTDVIDRITTGNFRPLQGLLDVDMGHNIVVDGLAPLPIPPAVAPDSVDRTLNGATLGFNFSVLGGVKPGMSTDYLIIKTTATSYVTGTISFQNSVTASGLAFAPAPEPSKVGLLLGGLFFAGLFVARRFQVLQS